MSDRPAPRDDTKTLELDKLLELERSLIDPQTPSSEVSVGVAEWLAGLEWRAVQAETALGRMQGRRLYRLADVLAVWARRPWRLGGLIGGLRDAWKARPLPELPEMPTADGYIDELAPITADPPPPEPEPRPLPYPHIRVAHAGRMSIFRRVATHIDLSQADLEEEMTTGLDMLLIEPGVDDPLEGLNSTVIDQFEKAGKPILLFARTNTDLQNPHIGRVDLVVTDDPTLAAEATSQGHQTLHIHPSIDETTINPIGWKQKPEHRLIVIADHPAITTDLDTLFSIQDQTSLYGADIPGFTPDQHIPERPTGPDLTQHAKNHLAAYTTPQLTATTTSHLQLVLELTASGTPVITPPDPTLDQLLENHHLTATNPKQLQTHIETLSHPPTRERHSVTARRHVLTNHTHTHRFEQLLTHLQIPTNTTPRISILLATKRPDYIEHALNNVTKQTWPNKELILILHGDDFDLTTARQQTDQLPYPTHIIHCPETTIFGDALNQGLAHATGTYISKMDDDDHYGPNHLTDLHTAHTYTNAAVIGKWGNVVYMSDQDMTLDYQTSKEEQYGPHLPGATVLMELELLTRYRFLRVSRGVDSTLWERLRSDGHMLYSTHRFNFIRVRHSDHTYQRGDERFIGLSSGYLRKGLDVDGSML